MAGGIHTAFYWSAIDRIAQGGCQFVLGIVLARLLAPNEYGLIGMLTIFFALAGAFSDAGLSTGLIQRKTISKDDETSVFILNITVGAFLTLLLCAGAPCVAHFYKQPILSSLLCVLSLHVFISSMGIVQFALLSRAMDFKSQTIIGGASILVSGGFGIFLAVHGFGVWSLVAQALSRAVASVALIWWFQPWRPSGRFRWCCIQSLWPFSSRLLAAGLFETAFQNLYSVLIGRVYTPVDLGYYDRANSTAIQPASNIAGIVLRVTLPYFSKIQEDRDKLKQSFRVVIRILGSLHVPTMAGLAAIAGPLTEWMLTEKWMPCVAYFRILCFVGMLYPLHALHLNVLNAQGRSDLFFRLEVIKKVLSILTIAVTLSSGILTMVYGILASSIIGYFINAFYTFRFLHYSWREQAKDVIPIAGASLTMAGIVSVIGYFCSGRPLTILLIQITCGIFLYSLFVWCGRKQTFHDLFKIADKYWSDVMRKSPIRNMPKYDQR
ncbi:MAG TPA: lipopolysaccharide biosynthesis protein [Candidatus Paceibacterota bacterium]|nr:lipopolysaccharide biosynthesis protein [Candidatus Paceibacterota bacterium]